MKEISLQYTLSIEGNDLDAKNAQKLSMGDALLLKRMCDEQDTYEILITDISGRELDMLSYNECLGIAPFLDDESLVFVGASVNSVTLTEGKTRSGDITQLSFNCIFNYDEDKLTFYETGLQVPCFLPSDNRFYCLCLFCALDYDEAVITQTHLNRYEFSIDIDSDSEKLLNIDINGEDYFYLAEVIFNESFTQCKIKAKIYNEKRQFLCDMEQKECEAFLELINHFRIFNNQQPLSDCTVDM